MDARHTPNWRRYPALYAALWKNSVVREMQFKTNFLLWIVVELLWFALQLAFMSVVYAHTDEIAGWTRWQVVLLVGCSNLVQQLFTAFFLSNLMEVSEHIRTGRLDFMLLLPVNTRFLVSMRKVDLGAFANAAAAAAVVGYALHRLGHRPSAAEWLGFGAMSLAGLAVHYSLMFLLSTVAFYTVRAQGIVFGYYNLFNIARIPDGAFPPGTFRRVFTFVLPMILVANVPARALLGTLQSAVPMALLAGMALALFAASEAFWRRALKHYAGAGS
ncbi:MAG: hypothetical protein DVB31_10815 [Verrucomicrobia bacterium]|nr:MAG: hypothetical protein DVB31_10815 [Verrucomicrobiota bacterium]